MKTRTEFMTEVEHFTSTHHNRYETTLGVKLHAKASFLEHICLPVPVNPVQAFIETSVGRVNILILDEGYHLPFYFEVDYPPADPDWD